MAASIQAVALWIVLVFIWIVSQRSPTSADDVRIVTARLRKDVRVAVIDFVRREIVEAAETFVDSGTIFRVSQDAIRSSDESFVWLRGAKPEDVARWIETELHDFSVAISNVYDSNDLPVVRIDVSWTRAE